MAASRSVICRQLIILMCRPVTPEDDILRSFRKKLRMTSVIRKLMIFFDYGLIHEIDILIISLDPASEPVHYLVRIVKQIFRLAFVTCPYLRTGALTVPDLDREFTLDIVSCIIGMTSIDDMAAEIMEGLSEYAELADKAMKKAVRKTVTAVKKRDLRKCPSEVRPLQT